jgi:hypothetical protein
MENMIIPTKQGQICKTISPLENEREGDVYIITDDLGLIVNDNYIEAVSLNDLQRNIKDPAKAKRKSIAINNLTVIGEDLEDYVASWNK